MNPRMTAITGTFQIVWVCYGSLIGSRSVVMWNLIAVAINFLTVGTYLYFSSPREAITKGDGGDHRRLTAPAVRLEPASREAGALPFSLSIAQHFFLLSPKQRACRLRNSSAAISPPRGSCASDVTGSSTT